MSKRLFRSQKEKMIGGVCGGLAEYFDIDPVIVRALFIVATLAWGAALIGYIILWIIVPFSPIVHEVKTDPVSKPEINIESEEEIHQREEKKQKKRVLLGSAIIIFGTLLLFDNLFYIVDFEMLLSFALIGVGAYILFKSSKSESSGGIHESN